MKKMGNSFRLLKVIGVLLVMLGCKNSGKNTSTEDSLAIRKKYATSEIVSPEDAITKMHIEKGFEVKLVAAEPLVVAPVAMCFDENGRIWVAEMTSYMPDTVGTGEDMRTGKIVILSDRNGDGLMDERKVFLDSLILPRALCLIEDGILVAESPNLWFYEIENDKPVKKTLVDDKYAESGNVEHQPNGLLRALDNWIYNAKSRKRYRKNGNKWLIEQTHFRGQWGISQDDYGRLFYNTNSENLLGDYFSPGLGAYNEHQRRVAGFNEEIVTDTKVFPARATTGVNRGYMDGILDDSLRLVNFTAACGPLIYNAHLFNKEYYGNAFVAEPAGNLIKRNILKEQGYRITGQQAYTKKEFLASEDERFRPVNLFQGPDGGIYVVDMYRGIIQHKAFLTTYLKNEIKQRELTQPLSCGRIYKIIPVNTKTQNTQITKQPNQLLNLLQDENGWVRHKAQQLLIDGKHKEVEPALRNLLSAKDNPIAVIHSLWTMEGLNILKSQDILYLLKQPQWSIQMQALSAIPSIITKNNYGDFLPVLQAMINDTLAAPYVAYLAHYIEFFNADASNELLSGLAEKYPADLFVADAIISNTFNKETAFYKKLTFANPDTNLILNKQLKKVIDNIAKAKNNANLKKLQKEFPRGVAIFQSACLPCHGEDGNGIRALGPPLNNSDWVVGDKNKLISILLYGLTGPVKIKDKVYKTPEINGDMPGIGQNEDFNDDDIAQILNFIRNSWNNKADRIAPGEINNIRNKFKARQRPFTMEELNQFR